MFMSLNTIHRRCIVLKKVINNPINVVEEMIEGFIIANKNKLMKIENVNGIIKRDMKEKVAIVIGGGSGHEPLFLGFVGDGLADGVAIGNVFAAPTPITIQEVAKKLENGRGVLFIYGNYSGDVLNFDMAAELLEMEGINTRTVRVCDDIISAPPERKYDRRGIAGDVFVIKIGGAASEQGLSLEEVTRLTQKAADNTFSMGVALTPGTNPNTGELMFTLEDDEIEFGVGLHGEPGIERTKLEDADKLTDKILDKILEECNINSGDEVCVLVNGLGSTTLMELFIVNRRVAQVLADKGIKIYDMDVNSYCTSQEMGGFSLSILKLDEELKKLYDEPAFSAFYHR